MLVRERLIILIFLFIEILLLSWNNLTTSNFVWADYGRSSSSTGYFPATGYRYAGTGAFTEIGERGLYWTSTSLTTIYAFDFGSSFVTPEYPNQRSHGYSNTGNSVTLTTRVGTGNTVYAIANTYNSTLFDGFVATSELKLKTLLSSTSTLEGIKVSDSSTSGLVMSGSKSNVTISSSGTTISSSDFAISRLSAKITLNITGLNGIVITGYAIKNLPKKGYIVARPNTNESLVTDLAVGDDASSTSTDRFDTSVTGLSTSSYATSFYMIAREKWLKTKKYMI